MDKTIRVVKIVNTFLLIALLLTMIFPIPKTNAYTLMNTKLNTDYVLMFVPYSGFSDTSITHFNNALYKWNSAVDITLMRREPTIRHDKTDYPSNDSTSQIYKVHRTDIDAPGQSYRYGSEYFFLILTSGDILINSAFNFTNSSTVPDNYYDTYTVFIHEAGHIAGLNHPTNTTDAVMWPQDSGECWRDLKSDDIAGIRAIYN